MERFSLKYVKILIVRRRTIRCKVQQFKEVETKVDVLRKL